MAGTRLVVRFVITVTPRVVIRGMLGKDAVRERASGT